VGEVNWSITFTDGDGVSTLLVTQQRKRTPHWSVKSHLYGELQLQNPGDILGRWFHTRLRVRRNT